LSETPKTDLLHEDLEGLRESAEKYRILIETTDTGFVILDEGGRVLDANAGYVKLTGHDRIDQIVGRPVTDWTAPADRERNAEEVRRCMRKGRVRNLEVDYVGLDGRVTPVEINATVGRGHSGPAIFTVCRDITARRLAEQALRNSEHRYRATIDSMSEAIHVVDQDLRIELLNRTGERWLRQLGIAGDIVGRRILDVFPFLSDSVRDEYRRAFAGEGPLVTAETNTVAGKEVFTETCKIPIVEAGRTVRVVTVIRDTTEVVRAAERLHQTEKMEALGQLAGGIAHDFNNQLTAVHGYAELLVSRVDEPEVREYATAIAQIARRSADLTRQLLAFARKGMARSVPLDLHMVIGDMVSMLARTIDPRITISSRLEASIAVIKGDPAQLQSALLNLALNARDAMPEGGELTFSSDVVEAGGEARRGLPAGLGTGEHLRVCVSDTGVGMTDDVRRRLFEPFFTTKGPGRGTGMGLAAVYGTVTSHQGAIQVDSEVGRGTTVTILLPLVKGIRVQEAASFDEKPTRGRGHVLVVDDEPAVRRVIAESLVKMGYRVTVSADGAAALACYRQALGEIDLVILDVMMPVLGGIGALAEMRRIDPAVRVILCSAKPVSSDEQQLIDGSSVVFLQKPFTMVDLARCAASMLSR
jgi:PAS domain S-box-containing protein